MSIDIYMFLRFQGLGRSVTSASKMRYIRLVKGLHMCRTLNGLYIEFIGFHMYLLAFFDFEGLGTALHPRYKHVTSALQMPYKFGGCLTN